MKVIATSMIGLAAAAQVSRREMMEKEEGTWCYPGVEWDSATGWTMKGYNDDGEWFMTHKVADRNQKMSHYQATTYCDSIDAIPVMPKTYEEHVFMLDMQLDTADSETDVFFIGVTGKWDSMKSQYKFSFHDKTVVEKHNSHWAYGYPKHTYGYSKVVSTKYGWKNVKDSEKVYGVNCEYICPEMYWESE